MGIKNARPKLFDAIDRESVIEVEMLLDKYPDLIDTAFFDGGVFNCATRAAWRGDVKMLKMLHKKGADMNLGVNEGYPPLMWTVIRKKTRAMKFLVDKCKVKLDISDSEGLTPLDNAIVNGNYDEALFLKKKGLIEKSIDFYKEKNDNFLFEQVNVEAFLESLKEHADEMTESAFMEKEEHPVIDPRQSYSEIFQRMKTFQPPKIVERSELPPELQKKRSLFTVAANMMYSYDISEKKTNAPKVKNVLKDIDVKKKDDYDNAMDRAEVEMLPSKRSLKLGLEGQEVQMNENSDEEEQDEVSEEDFEIGSPDKNHEVKTNISSKQANKFEIEEIEKSGKESEDYDQLEL